MSNLQGAGAGQGIPSAALGPPIQYTAHPTPHPPQSSHISIVGVKVHFLLSVLLGTAK